MQTHYGNYWPPSFGWTGNADPFVNPNVLVDFSFKGVSFGKMNRHVVKRFTAFLTELEPHLKGGLHAGKCGCYNPKSVTVGGTRSFHTFGIAIDVNWDTNPMGGTHGDMPHDIAHKLAAKYGLEWGGDWDSPKDQMHFEVHLSPHDAENNIPTIGRDVLDMNEAELRAIIRDELNKGVTVTRVTAWDRDKDGKLGIHNPETLFLGIPGYVTVRTREENADKKGK